MRTLLIITLLIVLWGCSFIPDPKTEYYVATPEDSMLVDCFKEPPPNVDKYMSGNDTEKLYLLTSAYNKQTQNVELCNIRWEAFRVWKVKQLKDSHK